MNKKYKKVIEDLGWVVREYGDSYDICQYSPAGEDFSFSISKKHVAQEIIEYAENFDPDEHAADWIESMRTVRGVPQSVRALIDDADAIKEMLDELARAIDAIE